MQKLHYRPASEGSGRSPKICNSSVDESVYIKMIRQERPLWDKKHRDYKNLEVKNKIWKEIAEKCGSTGNNTTKICGISLKKSFAQIRIRIAFSFFRAFRYILMYRIRCTFILCSCVNVCECDNISAVHKIFGLCYENCSMHFKKELFYQNVCIVSFFVVIFICFHSGGM